MSYEKGFLRSVCLSTALTSVTSTAMVTCCDGNGGDEDDLMTKVKKIISKSDLGSSDFNFTKEIDRIAVDLGSKVQVAFDTGVPTQISYGFVCGYTSGYALKKVGKAASIILGLGFITIQSLAYSGYIQIDHDALKRDVTKLMDLNNDGKVDQDDANQIAHKIKEVLNYNMPAGGGFGAGFYGGLRSG